MKIEASFVRSAATAADLPQDGLPEIALVGRSNVGKSTLINALARQRIARTSAAPGKTRLANLYRVRRGGNAPFYLVDLPGYGYARGAKAASRREAAEGSEAKPDRRARASANAALADGYGQRRRNSQADASERRRGASRAAKDDAPFAEIAAMVFGRSPNALLLVDARHPALASDRDAWNWLNTVVPNAAIVATKIDKLSRAERLRAMRDNEAVFEHPVLPVSAATGEGLDELWKLIDQLTTPE